MLTFQRQWCATFRLRLGARFGSLFALKLLKALEPSAGNSGFAGSSGYLPFGHLPWAWQWINMSRSSMTSAMFRPSVMSKP